MKYIRKIILVVGIICLALAIYEFAMTLETCKAWQARAWELWVQATIDYTTGKSAENPGVPASWWSQNPWTVSIYVWSSILKNWILTLVGAGSAIYNSYGYIRRQKYRTLLKRGGNLATKV
jgi:hypothetical protein